LLLYKKNYLLKSYSVSLFVKLSLVFAVLCSPSYAQFNFYKYSVGIGGGFNLPFADTKKANYSLATQITTDYYFTPYMNAGLEFQFGNMRGGEHAKKHFNNNFMLGTLNARMQLGQFYDRYDRLNTITSLIRGLYMGIGVGIIRNNVIGYMEVPIDATHPNGLKEVPSLNKDLIFPLNLGGNVYLKDMYGRDRWELNFNFQLVTAMSDDMDANISPNSNFNDMYNYLSIGVRYKFGTLGLDTRKNRLK